MCDIKNVRFDHVESVTEQESEKISASIAILYKLVLEEIDKCSLVPIALVSFTANYTIKISTYSLFPKKSLQSCLAISPGLSFHGSRCLLSASEI